MVEGNIGKACSSTQSSRQAPILVGTVPVSTVPMVPMVQPLHVHQPQLGGSAHRSPAESGMRQDAAGGRGHNSQRQSPREVCTGASAAVVPLGGRQTSSRSDYIFGATLGKGSFAVVKEAQRKETGQRFAVKMITRSDPAFDFEALRKEISTMQRINHPNCIRLHDVFEEDMYICLVLDLVTGGELFDRIIARGHYSEKDAAEVSKEVLLAVAYLHSQGIVHRDLKPENLLYMSNDESTPDYNRIKVADFGLARLRALGSPMRTMCGTPGYVAPEVLDPRLVGSQGYGAEIDVWSIGVVLYIMLCGFPPFYSENTMALFRQIRRGDYSFPSPYWDNITPQAKDLVRRMLVVNPRQRLTAQQCLQHEWIVNASAHADKALGAQHKAFLLIRRLPLFEQVDPSCLSEVTQRLKRVTVKANEYVIKSGDEGRCMYFVGSTPQQTIGSGVHLAEDLRRGIQRSKCLAVFVDGQQVTSLGTGDYFGEVALVSRSDHKRTADVQALCTCELFELSREDVRAIIKHFPILEARLQSMAEARLRRAQCSSTTPDGSNGSLNSSFGEEKKVKHGDTRSNTSPQTISSPDAVRPMAGMQQAVQLQHPYPPATSIYQQSVANSAAGYQYQEVSPRQQQQQQQGHIQQQYAYDSHGMPAGHQHQARGGLAGVGGVPGHRVQQPSAGGMSQGAGGVVHDGLGVPFAGVTYCNGVVLENRSAVYVHQLNPAQSSSNPSPYAPGLVLPMDSMQASMVHGVRVQEGQTSGRVSLGRGVGIGAANSLQLAANYQQLPQLHQAQVHPPDATGSSIMAASAGMSGGAMLPLGGAGPGMVPDAGLASTPVGSHFQQHFHAAQPPHHRQHHHQGAASGDALPQRRPLKIDATTDYCCNPADRALRNRDIFAREPSKQYLACPEAVPRVDGILRTASRMGLLQGLEVPHFPAEAVDFDRLSPIAQAAPPKEGEGRGRLESSWALDMPWPQQESEPSRQGPGAAGGAVAGGVRSGGVPETTLVGAAVGAGQDSDRPVDRPVKRGRH